MSNRVEKRHEISRLNKNDAQAYEIDEHYHEELNDGLRYAVFMRQVFKLMFRDQLLIGSF